MKRNIACVCGALAALMLAAASAEAQMPRGQHYDSRYSHNHYYANRGVRTSAPCPGGRTSVAGGRYYYSGGVWYGPQRPGIRRDRAADRRVRADAAALLHYGVGGGVPYYYANDTYYTWDAAQNGYEVVDAARRSAGYRVTRDDAGAAER